MAKNAAGATCTVQFDWTATPQLPANAGVVTITSGGVATLNFIGTATYDALFTITATVHGGSVSGTMGLTVQNPVASVDVTPDPATALIVCDNPSQEQFTATISYTTRPPNFSLPQINWSSFDTSVATISGTGLATAVDSTSSPTTITATADGIVSNAVSLDVSGGASITVTVTPNPDTIPAGSSDPSFHAAVTGLCTTCDVTWSVDDLAPPANGTVSPVGPNNDTTYTAPASVPAPSTVTVRATSTENTNCMGTADVTVIPTFGTPSETSLGGGQNPQALVIGQFNLNNNANLDIAVADEDTNDVSILLGDGAGNLTLNGTTSTTASSNPVSIAQGFFNSGALPDLATANFGTDDAAILLGDGNGSFNAASLATVVTDQAPQSVAVGDFDGVNGDDLATANFLGDGTDGNITILLSNGDGTFTEAPSSPITLTGSGPWAIAAGKIDGGANLDLVVADLTGDAIWILLGNGDGTFNVFGSISLPGAGPAAVVIADFDGDTSADLAIVNQGTAGASCPPSGNPDTVTILLGLGDGTFNAPVTYPVGSNPRAIAVGDFNKDGSVDLVTANYCSDDVSLLFGVGDGTFQSAVSYSTGTPGSDRPTGVAVGDLDGDTFDDIAVTDSGTDSVSVLLNNN